MGYAVISKKLPNGQVAFSSFLVDIYCLGIKDCFSRVGSEFEFDEFRRQSDERFDLEDVHQTCVRKLVEGAVEYADSLGFRPHKDYKTSKLIFGDIDASLCPSSYQYGKDGKPLYISGPYDNLARQQRIIAQLNKSQGTNGAGYLVGNHGDDYDEDYDEDGADEDGTIDSEHLKLVSFSITEEPIDDEYTRRIPAEFEEQFEELYHLVLNSPKKAKPILLEVVEKYPDIVQLRNFLTIVYSATDEQEKADSVAKQLYHDEPNYLFARVNYAEICLRAGKIEEVSQILDGCFNLQSFYPDRDTFHLSEVIGFYSMTCRYYLAINEYEAASVCLKFLQQIAPDHQVTKHMQLLFFKEPGFLDEMMSKFFPKWGQ